MILETYLNHPTFGILFRICLADGNQELFASLYAQRVFFLVEDRDAGAPSFETVGRSEARVLLENRLRLLRRVGQFDEYNHLKKTYQIIFQ